MTTLDTEEEVLRRAVGRDDFSGAEISSRRYTNLLESGLKNLSPADAESRLRRACSLFDWARHNLHGSRARIGENLGQLEKLSHYHATIPVPPAAIHTWNIDA